MLRKKRNLTLLLQWNMLKRRWILNTESRSKDLAENQTTNTISQYVTWCPSTFSCEIPRENVVIEKIIGKGAFGQVTKGTVICLRGRTQATLKAVKILKGVIYWL